MTRSILTFGDSNTFGTPPMQDRGFHPRLADRWPVAMAAALPCTLIEAGLGGRTAGVQDASGGEMHLDGLLGLQMALLGHGPIDDLVIMLGTNDMKIQHGNTAEAVAGAMARLLSFAHSADIQAQHGGFRTLLICPPRVIEGGTLAPDFLGAAAKSAALPALYAQLAAAWGCGFLDAGTVIDSDPLDGVHFGATAHIRLGQAVAKALS